MARNRQQETGKRRGPAGPGAMKAFWRGLVRVGAWCLAAAILAALSGGGLYGLRCVFFTSNPAFTLTEIRVYATGQLRPADILRLVEDAGVEAGHSNLFRLDVRDLRQRLEREVLVDRATVVRRLPGRLEVSIYERQPIAQIKSRPRRLIDRNGWLLPYRVDANVIMLPEITGMRDTQAISIGMQVTATVDPMLVAALEFLRLQATRPEGQDYDVATIQVDYSDSSLKVHLRPRSTFRSGASIVVPARNMSLSLGRLDSIVAERKKAGLTTGFVDVTYETNVPVRP